MSQRGYTPLDTPVLPRAERPQTDGHRQTSLYSLKNKKRTWDT